MKEDFSIARGSVTESMKYLGPVASGELYQQILEDEESQGSVMSDVETEGGLLRLLLYDPYLK